MRAGVRRYPAHSSRACTRMNNGQIVIAATVRIGHIVRNAVSLDASKPHLVCGEILNVDRFCRQAIAGRIILCAQEIAACCRTRFRRS